MNRIILVILISVFFKTESIAFELIDGKSRSNGMESTDEYKQILKMGGYGLNSYLKDPNTSIYYVILGDTFGRLDLSKKEYLGNWHLTPWEQAVRMKGEGTNWKGRPIIATALGGDKSKVKEPGKMVLATDLEYSLPSFKSFIGCLADTPLRYGDIDKNGSYELVLFLDRDLVVFSPKKQATIFATRFFEKDELSPASLESWFEGSGYEPATQYVASSGFRDGLRGGFAATRSFAKTFFGDFNNDKKKDIIVWRKLYESRLREDDVKGFKLAAELYVHYQLEEGVYVLQTNNPSVNGEFELDPEQQNTIQGWLESNNLTWQKGFPSKSECKGQEGELIPEMHDPLLNDPDV